MVTIDKLSIIVPCYNEARTIHNILDKIILTESNNNINLDYID